MEKEDSESFGAKNPFEPDLGAFEIFYKFLQKSKNWKPAYRKQPYIKNKKMYIIALWYHHRQGMGAPYAAESEPIPQGHFKVKVIEVGPNMEYMLGAGPSWGARNNFLADITI